MIRGSSVVNVLNDLAELEHFRVKAPRRESSVGEIVQELTQRAPLQLFEYVSTVRQTAGPNWTISRWATRATVTNACW